MQHHRWVLASFAIALFPFVRSTVQDQDARPEENANPEKVALQESFELTTLLDKARAEDRSWVSFLDRKSMSAGIYRLTAGSQDGQSPHALDELYYVVEGKAGFEAGGERFEARAGSLLFVAKNVEHRFVDIEEDLVVVVFFAKEPEPAPEPEAGR